MTPNTQSALDLSRLTVLVGLKTEFKEGKRTRQGRVTGVFQVRDTGCSEDRFVVELNEHGRYYYVAYRDLAAADEGPGAGLAAA